MALIEMIIADTTYEHCSKLNEKIIRERAEKYSKRNSMR